MIPYFRYIMDLFLGRLLLAGLMAGVLTCACAAQAPVVVRAPGSSALAAAGGSRFVVVLDAAHGGEDGGGQVGAGQAGTGQAEAGAANTAVAEKTVTLALSVRLRSLLTARGFTVVTTREGNVNLDGNARAQIANHATLGGGSAACLSFHASETGSGVHIFVSSLAAAQPSRFLAWKTAQSTFVTRSLKLAGTVNSALERSSVAGAGDSGGTGGGTGAGSIPVLLGRASLPGVDSMTCPAVVIEVAPIRGSDRKVVTEATDPEYQTQIVEALAAALLEWKTDAETESGPDSHSSGGRLP